jgi:hypothetical protein
MADTSAGWQDVSALCHYAPCGRRGTLGFQGCRAAQLARQGRRIVPNGVDMAKRTSERFLSAYAKLQWAKHHIDQLNVQSTAFLRERLVLYVRKDASFGDRTMSVKYKGYLPPTFGLMIGDIITNLRDTLDHIVWELVSPNLTAEHAPESVRFPFPKRKESLGRVIKESLIDLAGPDARRIVCETRPHPEGDDELYSLHALSNMVKHRIVAIVSDYVHLQGLKAQDRYPFKPYVPFNDLRMGHGPNLLRDIHTFGMGHLKVRKDNTVDHDQFDMTFHIVFEQDQPFAGLSVVPTLIALAKKVEGILGKFDAAYPSVYSPHWPR